MRDLYEILNVPRTAGPEEIRRAYRRLAVESHPDRNRGSAEAEERFKELAEAFRTLSDPARRRVYDRYGHEGLRRLAGYRPDGPDLAAAVGIFAEQVSALVREELGAPAHSGQRSPEPRQVTVRLTLEEVARGARKRVRLPCPRCGGAGVERGPRAGPCRDCAGQGTDSAGAMAEVDVPPGVASGETLPARRNGVGQARRGTGAGVVAVVEVADDPRFVRAGADLVMEMAAPSPGARGTEREVTTPAGTAWVRVPAGAGPGDAITVPGQGLPSRTGSGRGDLIVKLVARAEEPESVSSAIGPKRQALAEQGGRRQDERLNRSVAAVVSAAVVGLAGAGALAWLLSSTLQAGVTASATRAELVVAVLLVGAVLAATAFLASLVLAYTGPQVLAFLAAARDALRSGRSALRQTMRRIGARTTGFFEHERRQPVRPLLARLGRLQHALERAGEPQIARLDRIATRLSQDAARLRDALPATAWGSVEAHRMRKGAWRAPDAFLATGLLTLAAVGLAAANIWILGHAVPPLAAGADGALVRLGGFERAQLLPVLLTLGAIASGVLVQALEGMKDERALRTRLIQAGPYLLAAAVILVQVLAFSALTERVDLAGLLGLPPGNALAAITPYALVFGGAAGAVVLMSLGYGVWRHLRQGLAAAADRAFVRRFHANQERLEALSEDLAALRSGLDEVAHELDGISREITGAWVRATGLDPRDGTLADAVRAAAERLARRGSLAPEPEPRSHGEVAADLTVGGLGFVLLVALGAFVYASLYTGLTATGTGGVLAGLLSLAGVLGLALGGSLIRDAAYGPRGAPSLLMLLPGFRGRRAVATLVAAAILFGAVFAGWLAVQAQSPEAGAGLRFAYGALLAVALALWSLNLDAWILWTLKLAYLAFLALGWLAAAAARAVLFGSDVLAAAAMHAVRIARVPGVWVREKSLTAR